MSSDDSTGPTLTTHEALRDSDLTVDRLVELAALIYAGRRDITPRGAVEAVQEIWSLSKAHLSLPQVQLSEEIPQQLEKQLSALTGQSHPTRAKEKLIALVMGGSEPDGAFCRGSNPDLKKMVTEKLIAPTEGRATAFTEEEYRCIQEAMPVVKRTIKGSVKKAEKT